MKQELYKNYFQINGKGKKVTVMGLGLLGRGIGDTAFLASLCDEVLVTDKKSVEELETSIETLKNFSNIKYFLGNHRLEDFKDRDFVLKSAGVPIESEFIKHARDNNVPVYMSAVLITKIIKEQLKNVKIIGITGTRGKSTTTHIIEHILTNTGHKVHLGGNVRGVANLPLLEEIEDGDFLVLELDSWQLQGFGDLKISPDVAVFTSFMDDHLNYYKGDRDLYFKDKANIFLNQKEGDVCIVSAQTKEIFDKQKINKKIIVPEIRNIKSHLIGEHNQTAITLAIEVAKHCGVSEVEAVKAVENVKSVEGRLEYMGDFNDVKIFNDNNATTPDATIVAIKSINETFNKKPILIIGGTDKNLDLTALEKVLENDVKEIIYLSGTGTDKISLPKKYEFEKLEDCVTKAFDVANDGDIILYSPAFASFSKYFRNEYEKNDAFVSFVMKYQ